MARKGRIVLGLNSGTSADGVDAVACEIHGRGLAMKIKVLGHVGRTYLPSLRDRLLAVMAPAATRTEEICRLETDVGRAFADTAELLIRKLGLRRIDLVGSHGQTICHLPPRRPPLPSSERARMRVESRATGTLQIGDPAIIAARVRCPVVHHFRQADMAVGGQGAPLVPWTDYVLFSHPQESRVVQNIGGIANLTYLPAGGGPDDVIAFDTGPGNMVMDALVRYFTKGRKQYDAGGRWAASGRLNMTVMSDMLDHPFLRRFPPKSCGREDFGEMWVRDLLRRHNRRHIRPQDWLMTAASLTAAAIFFSVAAFVPASRGRGLHIHDFILCGGGALNETLRALIQQYFSASDVRIARWSTTADHDIQLQAKEGVSFAMLAAACADRVPANLTQVTGARRRVVLGQICDVGGGR